MSERTFLNACRRSFVGLSALKESDQYNCLAKGPTPPCSHPPVRSHFLGEPRLDDAQQSESRQCAEAVDLDQLPDQTHAEDALQRRDPNEVGQAQTLWEQSHIHFVHKLGLS